MHEIVERLNCVIVCLTEVAVELDEQTSLNVLREVNPCDREQLHGNRNRVLASEEQSGGTDDEKGLAADERLGGPRC